jgi:hypothetical protein
MSHEKEPALAFPGIKLDPETLDKRRAVDIMRQQLAEVDAVIKSGRVLDPESERIVAALRRRVAKLEAETINV